MLWLQCNEETLLKIGQKAVAKGCSLTLTEKQGETFVVEYEEPCAQFKTKRGTDVLPSESDKWTRQPNEEGKMVKVRKTYKRYTGYVELGHEGWYLIVIHPMLVADILADILLGPHVKGQGAIITNVCVPHERQYIKLNMNKDIVTNFTQHYEVSF